MNKEKYSPNNPTGGIETAYDIGIEKELVEEAERTKELLDMLMPKKKKMNDLEILIRGDETRWN